MTAGEVLRHAGREVSPHDLDQQRDSLGSLSPGVAEDVLLATYDVVDGVPGGRFIPHRGALGSLRAILRQGRPSLLFVFVAAAASLVPALAVPLLLRVFVDRYLVAGDEQWVQPVAWGVLGAAVIAALAVGLQYAVLRLFVLRLDKAGLTGFTWQVLTMPPPAVQSFGSGDLVARFNAAERLSYQGGLLLPLALVNLLNSVVFAVALVLLNPLIGLTTLVVAVVSVVLSLAVLKWRRNLQRDSDRDLVALTAVTADLVGAIESIKAAAWEQFAFRRWSQYRVRNARSLSRLGVATQVIALIPTLTTAFGLGALLAVGCALVISSGLSIGTVVAAQGFAVLLLASLAMLVWSGVLIQSILSASDQVDDVMRSPQDPELIEVTPSQPSPRLAGNVTLRDLTFGYDRDQPPLLDGLTLEIPAGSRVALVGASGSGKTTVARLAIGELRPWSGDILIDGTPRLLVPRDRRTGDIAYVPQEPSLFPGTLRDNLTLWDEGISDQQLLAAAADACIDDAVTARAGGFQARVNDADSGFSGGELQRLAIARALVRDPRILVLDEATSALDPIVEEQVEHNLRRRGCTCLIVAHRLSTIRDADRILVIDGGRIIQDGTYEQLRSWGAFAELLHG